MKVRSLLLAAGLFGVASAPAMAAVSASEAAKLGGPQLTEFGAERAGNADGSIPPYTGGTRLKDAPASFKPGSGRYPDPFASEKPLYSVNASNMAKYADYLTEGTKAVLKRFPSSFRLDVYPSHRSMWYTDTVLKRTIANATSATLVGDEPGDGVKGAFGGIPFPIPKNGYEVLWNNYLHASDVESVVRHTNYMVDSSGHRTYLGNIRTASYRPYYDESLNGNLKDPYFYKIFAEYIEPAAQSGTRQLINYSLNYSENDQLVWAYLPGQRRVRVAPEYAYDTPAAVFGGAINYDEIGMFSGRPDRFDMKLVGKKEMLIPYNAYKAVNGASVDEIMQTSHFNPDDVRWEKHRVWVVDATLRPGKRHVYSRRTFYFDEDTWSLAAVDGYDQAGQIYRVGVALPIVFYDKGTVRPDSNAIWDFSKGMWLLQANPMGENDGMYLWDKVRDANAYTMQAVQGGGVR